MKEGIGRVGISRPGESLILGDMLQDLRERDIGLERGSSCFDIYFVHVHITSP